MHMSSGKAQQKPAEQAAENDERRFLFLSPNLPYPPDSGGNQRTFLLYQALAQLGRVDFLLVGDVSIPEELLPTLRAQFNYLGRVERKFGPFAPQTWSFKPARMNGPAQKIVQLLMGWRLTLFRSADMQRAVGEWLARERYDAIVTRYLATACQTGAFGARTLYVDVDDLESEVWQSRANATPRRALAWMFRTIASSYARKERALTKQCAAAWVTKASDVDRLGGGTVGLLQNIPFAAYPHGVQALAPGARTVVLGVGLYDWLPNRQGFDWFIREVWPIVYRRRPDCELHLVGKLSDPVLRAQWSQTPGVRHLGRVDDLHAAYQQALFTVAPILSGGGTNIKVIESLALGRCCVVTPHAVKGFEDMPGLHRAQGALAFAERCIELLADADRTVNDGLAASRAARQTFSFERFGAAIREAVMRQRQVPSMEISNKD